MSDNERIATSETKALYAQVTPQDVVDFLNEKGRSGEHTTCNYCGIGDIGVFPSPDGKTAAMVSSPIPDGSGLAVWSYITACKNCGNILFFSATQISRYVQSKKS
jgi:hypothetical protein